MSEPRLRGFSRGYLLHVLSYDPETGVLTSRRNRGSRIKAGDVVGTPNGNGYLRMTLDGKLLFVHRVAYFMHHGLVPPEVDHRNLKRADNRARNLRAAERPSNCANSPRRAHNASGFKGVHRQNKTGRWRAQIKVGYKNRHLGYFDTPQEAHAAYAAAAQAAFGSFARAQ